MDKLEEIVTKQTSIKHIFHCDHCGKYLGTVIEESDGYYDPLGETQYRIFICDKWYEKKAILCNKCKQEFDNKIDLVLRELGFNAK